MHQIFDKLSKLIGIVFCDYDQFMQGYKKHESDSNAVDMFS